MMGRVPNLPKTMNPDWMVTEHCFDGFHSRCHAIKCECSCHAGLSLDELYAMANLHRAAAVVLKRGA